MKKSNPMRNPATVEKMRRTLRGRTFLARGGNGKPTKQQIVLAKALGLLENMEHPIPTAPVREQFKSLPNCYKVSLAYPERKIAIEVDGKTHLLKRWKFLDRRKTAVLNALGWSVFRVTNEEVDSCLPDVLKRLAAFTILK
jgi:hypothetical protein